MQSSRWLPSKKLQNRTLLQSMTVYCMAFQSREFSSINSFSFGKYPRIQSHMLLLFLFALISVVALFTSVTHISGRGVGAASATTTGLGRERKPHLYRSNITNDSTFLAFVISEPDVEHEKAAIKEVLKGSSDPHRRLRGRAGSWPSRLPKPRYAPFWSQFRALLRTWMAMKWYDPKIMQSLVTTIKEPIDRHHHRSNRKKRLYGTCAVVGNSGILLNSTFGEAIDAHEVVVRLNNARIKGFEKHVGGKTTIAFMNSNILHKCARRVRCYCHPYGDDISIVMYVSQVPHLMDMAMCDPVHAAPLLVTDPRFDALTSRIAKWYSVREFVEQTGKVVNEWPWVRGFHYSSGMQAVMLALGMCEEVDLYGFGKGTGTNRTVTRHHYHTAQRKELHVHDYEAEYVFYDDLVMASHSNSRSNHSIPFLSFVMREFAFLLCACLEDNFIGQQ